MKQTTHTGHAALRQYLIGYALAILLTLAAFWLALVGPSAGLSHVFVLFALSILAVMQIVAHFRFFLHLDRSPAQRGNVLALLLTVLISVILLGGSVWVMYDLGQRMGM